MACSNAKALKWNVAWSINPNPSHSDALGVHVDSYKENTNSNDGDREVPTYISIKKKKLQDGGMKVVA
jgi:hypothetical protein